MPRKDFSESEDAPSVDIPDVDRRLSDARLQYGFEMAEEFQRTFVAAPKITDHRNAILRILQLLDGLENMSSETLLTIVQLG